jgi:DNA-binding IclR family transcriptional regulator
LCDISSTIEEAHWVVNRGSKTLDNGIRLLKLIASEPAGRTVTQLSRALGLHRTVTYRLLLTLSAHDLIAQAANGTYHAGSGLRALTGHSGVDWRAIAREPLRRLAEATGATAHLTLLDGTDAVSAAVIEPSNALVHVAYRPGLRHPLTQGAAGMAILLGRPARAGERVAVRRARRDGWVASHGEIQKGAWGLAAPVRPAGGDAVGSVGVVALAPLDQSKVAPLVLAAAAEIATIAPAAP